MRGSWCAGSSQGLYSELVVEAVCFRLLMVFVETKLRERGLKRRAVCTVGKVIDEKGKVTMG